MFISEGSGAGRARAARDGQKKAHPVGEKPLCFDACSVCHGQGQTEAGARCEECHGEGRAIEWDKPLTRILLMRRVTRPVFREAYGLVRPAVAVLVQLIDHRNAETAQCNPSRDVLGGEADYSVRSVSEGTAQLASLGFIEKEQELRTGWATTNAYRLTPRFFEALATSHSAGTGCNSSSRPAAIFADKRGGSSGSPF
jgi:hypothetical protein